MKNIKDEIKELRKIIEKQDALISFLNGFCHGMEYRVGLLEKRIKE